jgi:hypothetical protein
MAYMVHGHIKKSQAKHEIAEMKKRQQNQIVTGLSKKDRLLMISVAVISLLSVAVILLK